MIAGGIVMMVFGALSLIGGIILNSDDMYRLEALFRYGTAYPGNIPIVVGVFLMIGGLVLLICGCNRKKQKDAERMRMYGIGAPNYAPSAPQGYAPPAPPVQAPPVQAPPVQAPPPIAAPQLRIQCIQGSFAGRRFPITGKLVLGRDAQRCDLVFPANADGISGVHCMVSIDGSAVWLKDLGSTYGTYTAGGRRLAANEAVNLRVGEQFWLGSEKQLFVIAPKGGI